VTTVSWSWLIGVGLVGIFMLFGVVCLFIVGARGEDDQQTDNPEAEVRKTEIEPPARSGRRKKLH
jgi:hypothetical protein